MDKAIINKLIAEMQSKKANSELDASYNKELALKNELFFKLEQFRASGVIAFSKESDPQKKQEIEKLLIDIKQKQNEILKALKLNIKPKYDCKQCEDSGYLQNGKICNCLYNAYLDDLAKKNNLKSLIKFTFNDNIFKEDTQLGKLYNTFGNYCEKFPNNNKKIITISGKVGGGKSCLISSIANEVISKDFSVLFMTAFELNNIFLKYHSGSKTEKSNMMEHILDCDLLIIDDLGSEPIFKNVTVEYLFNVINTRYLSNKHIMFSTNLTGNDIRTKYGERIFSRLTHKEISSFIELENDDIRNSKK